MNINLKLTIHLNEDDKGNRFLVLGDPVNPDVVIPVFADSFEEAGEICDAYAESIRNFVIHSIVGARIVGNEGGKLIVSIPDSQHPEVPGLVH